MVYGNQVGAIERNSKVKMLIVSVISSIILTLSFFASAYATDHGTNENQVDQMASICDTNYFPTQNMWEITWGMQYSDINGVSAFTMDSYGGLVGVNGAPVPSYMTNAADWHWLYVTEANIQDERTVTYEFADGTVITAVVSADQNGCPSVEWSTAPPVVAPETKDDCKNGGYESYGYKNQGQCIASIQSSEKSRHNR